MKQSIQVSKQKILNYLKKKHKHKQVVSVNSKPVSEEFIVLREMMFELRKLISYPFWIKQAGLDNDLAKCYAERLEKFNKLYDEMLNESLNYTVTKKRKPI